MDDNQLNQIADPMTDNPIVDNQNTDDEQELSKVLDSINQQVDQQAAAVDQAVEEAQDINKAEALEDNFDTFGQDFSSNDFADLNKQLSEQGKDELTEAKEANKEDLELNQSNFNNNEEAPKEDLGLDQSNVNNELPKEDEIVNNNPKITNTTFEQLKASALNDLKPLINNLDLSDEEKFEVHLLLIRSTDDETLLEPAYQAARAIEDETKRAQALLDVVKEIDYFSSKK